MRAWYGERVGWSVVIAVWAGCAQPGTMNPVGEETGSSETGQPPSDSTSTGAMADSTTGVDSTTGGPWEAPLARGGIAVEWVQANQGVGVSIGAEGTGVGPADRAAPLIANRITLFRAFWTVPDDWAPREIEGRLIVRHADGTEEVVTNTALVDGPAFEGDLNRSFYWGLMAEQTQPGLQYRVELYETTPDHDADPEPAVPPMLPNDGSLAYVGIEDSYLVLKTVVVPYIYDDGAGCSTTPDTSEETMQLYQDLMFMQNPIDRLDFEIHEPIVWNTPLESFLPLHSHLVGLRGDDMAPPETYYYGLIDVCSGGLGGAGGQANGIPDDPVDPAMAYQRVSAGLSLDPDWSAETFVHEVGHSQGRRHVACDGEAGTDPSYPYQGGDVGEWGFGVVDFLLRHPTVNKDYMTYCHPTWVGTWGWNKVYPVIRGLSEWDEGFPGGPPAPPGGTQASPLELALSGNAGKGATRSLPFAGSVLIGSIEPNGREHWITAPGELPASAERGPVHVELRAAGTLVAELPAHVQSLQDGDGGTLVIVPLPDRWSEVTRITRVAGSDRSTVPRALVTEHHHQRLVRSTSKRPR
jgi:hypothetical protein